MYAAKREQPRIEEADEQQATLEVQPVIRGLKRIDDWPEIPVRVRDAAPNGLLVLVSKEDGWLWKEELDMDRELSRNTPVNVCFHAAGRLVRISGKVVWSEAGQAGVRLHMSSIDPAAQTAFAAWIRRLADEIR